MNRTAAIVTLSLAAAMSGPTLANTTAEPEGKQIVVRYADLDISRPAGAEVLIGRMRAAASEACGPAPDLRDLVRYRFYRNCLADTLARAVAAVNSAIVTDLYRGSSTILADN